jgi:hypothetical protein
MTDTVHSLLADAAARVPEATAVTFPASLDAEPIRLTHAAYLARLHRTTKIVVRTRNADD